MAWLNGKKEWNKPEEAPVDILIVLVMWKYENSCLNIQELFVIWNNSASELVLL